MEKELLSLSLKDYQNYKFLSGWKRINSCQAWFTTTTVNHVLCNVIKSYDTIVAVYSLETKTLYSLGRFSMTTYQHIRKFKNNYTRDKYNTKEINLELCNWFK